MLWEYNSHSQFILLQAIHQSYTSKDIEIEGGSGK